MKITELAKFHVVKREMASFADKYGEIKCNTLIYTLEDYKDDIISLFNTEKDVSVETIEELLKQLYTDVVSIEDLK